MAGPVRYRNRLRCDNLRPGGRKDIYCNDKAKTPARREQHMRSQRESLDQRRSIHVLAGATLTDDGSASTCSLFIINVTRAEAEAAGDPFTKASIFERIAITRMRKSQ